GNADRARRRTAAGAFHSRRAAGAALATAAQVKIPSTRVQHPLAALPGQKARRLRQFEGRDRWIALTMVGIPTILHVSLIWIPTIASILLSFTEWKGIRLDDIKWVGL